MTDADVENDGMGEVEEPREAPGPEPAPPNARPNVILEDIDAIEARRLRRRGRKYGVRDLFGQPGPASLAPGLRRPSTAARS